MTNRTKGKIAQSFKDLVCRKSFQKITINDIAKECGMTRENFYYHFHDKYDIVRWIMEEELLGSVEDTGNFVNWMMDILTRINEDIMFYTRIIKEIGREPIKHNFYPYMDKMVIRFVEKSIASDIWTMRKEKQNFVNEFFCNTFIEFIFNSVEENKLGDLELFRQNLEFLIDTYLPFVRYQKENT